MPSFEIYIYIYIYIYSKKLFTDYKLGINNPTSDIVLHKMPGAQPYLPPEVAKDDFQLMIYQCITMSVWIQYIYIQYYIHKTHFTSYKYTVTQNKLISSFRWPKHWVSSKSALDLHKSYTSTAD